jgi:hypothetical protein
MSPIKTPPKEKLSIIRRKVYNNVEGLRGGNAHHDVKQMSANTEESHRYFALLASD